jgi:glycosyltransferase involved in cell wall biosynthesis
MRALLVTDWLPGTGGADHYMVSLRNGLRAAGEDVRLLTSTAGTAADGSAEYQAYGTEQLVAKAVLQIANPFAVRTLRSALREFRPDVVLVNMFEHQLSPAILGPLRDVPAVLMVTDYKPICPTGSKLLPSGRCCTVQPGLVCWRAGCLSLPHWIRDQLRYALIRAGRRSFDRVLACSRWVQRELALSGIVSDHVTLPIPLPGPGFRRAPAREPTFVYCGRLDPTKGIDLLLRAFACLRTLAPAASLRIVGRGSERPMLENLASALGLAHVVEFRGWVAPGEVEHELTDAWALVVPSRWAEPLGLVALEAIARGVPVIASGSGGLGEVVKHGTSGLVFANGDEAALGAHLAAVATGAAFADHTLPENIVAETRAIHSESRHIDRMREIFREVVGVQRGGSVTRTA